IFERALCLIRAAFKSAKTEEGRQRCENVTLATDYAEPGYSTRNGLVAFGNWNTIDGEWDARTHNRPLIDGIPKRLCDALEKIGADIEWSDEWKLCDGCQKPVRTKADSYSWQRSYIEKGDKIVCLECLDPVEHLKALEGGDDKCNTISTID